MIQHFLSLTDITPSELLLLLSLGKKLKSGESPAGPDPLGRKTLLLLFYKESTRTRVSFQVGMFQLGGLAIELNAGTTQLTRGESIQDTARVFSRYADGIVIRTFGQDEIVEWSSYSNIPVINGLTDRFHPCQILADIMAIREAKGKLRGLKISYIGDGNNVLNSWINACCLADFELVISTPHGFEPDPTVLSQAGQRGFQGPVPRLVRDPREAVAGADVIYTDVWTSMGQEEKSARRLEAFKDYQLNQRLVSEAKDDALVLHCLPAHRGEEITNEVIEGRNSAIFNQAENRLHMQKALLLFLMGDRTMLGEADAGESI